jgi:Tfp pilus assembly protein PilV
MRIIKLKSGIGLVEIVIAVSILSICVISIFSAYRLYLSAIISNTDTVKALYLAEEGVEVVRHLRDISYDRNILNSSSYYLNFSTSTNKWSTTTSYVLTDNIFYRKITLSSVYRDLNDQIAQSGTIDPNTKLVTVDVSWDTKIGTSTKSLQAYITNLYEN